MNEKRVLISELIFRLAGVLFKKLSRRKTTPSKDFIEGYNLAASSIIDELKKIREGGIV